MLTSIYVNANIFAVIFNPEIIQIMKKSINLFLTLVTLTMLFISCGSDTENGGLSENKITLDEQPFSINESSIGGVSIKDSGHTVVTLISTNGTQKKTLQIDLPTFTKETIANTYSFPEKEGHLVLNEFLTNYIFFEKESITSVGLSNGTAIIKHNGGNNYSITIDLTMQDGKIFKGTYSGDFQVMFMNR